jgi:hypothetical protein
MSFPWTRYLDLAKELAGKPVTVEGREAKLRSAISRAYYAAFHHARDYLIATNGPLPPYTSNEHDYVKRWYIERNDRVQRQIGSDLDRLRLDRNIADYADVWRGGIGELSKTVDLSLMVAARIVGKIEQLTKG